MNQIQNFLRKIPSLDRILGSEAIKSLIEAHGRARVTDLLHSLVEGIRKDFLSAEPERIRHGEEILEHLSSLLEQRLKQDRQLSLKKVVNATGVIVHTNLGRSPMAVHAADAVFQIITGYSNLEYDLENGCRGHRDRLLVPLLQKLLPCEDVTFVNNAAAALFLTLFTIGQGGETIVSRGELVEIGGSFRIPDIMSASGTILREVGTTNKTRDTDYEKAIGPHTKMILKVHTSNFKIVGFVEAASLKELATIAARHHLPLVEDCGSGYLHSEDVHGLGGESQPRRSLAEGCDLVLFSGDKLLGGPQAGIIAGKSEWIQRIRSSPLMRILRLDKMNIAALEATLQLHFLQTADQKIPIWQMIGKSAGHLKKKATLLHRNLSKSALPGWRFDVVPLKSLVGGGSCPADSLPSYGLRIVSSECSISRMERGLRGFNPPIIVRREEDSILMDVRTLLPGEERHIRRFFSSTSPGNLV